MSSTSGDHPNLMSDRSSNGKCCYNIIPARFVFVALGFYGFGLVYAYKVVLSVTIVAMVNSTGGNQISTDCQPSYNSTISHLSTTALPTSPSKTGTFNWNGDQRAAVLGSFFYGYALTQLPAGILAERFGVKWIFGGSMLITAVLSLLGPLAAHTSFYLFLATRVGQGLAEGFAFPCMHAMLAQWLPKFERSLMSTIIYTGSQIGTVITLPLAGYLCSQTFLGGWPAIFYILGFVGIIWFVLWSIFIYETPDRHPHISLKELDYIRYGQGLETIKTRPPTPWKQIFTSVPVWALVITHVGQNWGFLTILTELPTYFQTILNLDIKHNGLMSSLPYLLQALCGWLAGFFGDRLRRSGRVNINIIRKVCNSIGFFGSGICLVGVAIVGCNSSLSIALFALAMGLNGFTFSGFAITHVDMAPSYAGTLMGLTNSIANLPGFLAPIAVDMITYKNNTLSAWQTVFYISAAVYFATSLVYIFFGTAKLQKWGNGDGDEDKLIENREE